VRDEIQFGEMEWGLEIVTGLSVLVNSLTQGVAPSAAGGLRYALG
jgi:hypothetical protein